MSAATDENTSISDTTKDNVFQLWANFALVFPFSASVLAIIAQASCATQKAEICSPPTLFVALLLAAPATLVFALAVQSKIFAPHYGTAAFLLCIALLLFAINGICYEADPLKCKGALGPIGIAIAWMVVILGAVAFSLSTLLRVRRSLGRCGSIVGGLYRDPWDFFHGLTGTWAVGCTVAVLALQSLVVLKNLREHPDAFVDALPLMLMQVIPFVALLMVTYRLFTLRLPMTAYAKSLDPG